MRRKAHPVAEKNKEYALSSYTNNQSTVNDNAYEAGDWEQRWAEPLWLQGRTCP